MAFGHKENYFFYFNQWRIHRVNYRIVNTRCVQITSMGTHLTLIFVCARWTGIQFDRISFFTPARKRSDSIATDTVAAHFFLVALVNV